MENDDKRDENLIILKNVKRINIWTESSKKIRNTIEQNEIFLNQNFNKLIPIIKPMLIETKFLIELNDIIY